MHSRPRAGPGKRQRLVPSRGCPKAAGMAQETAPGSSSFRDLQSYPLSTFGLIYMAIDLRNVFAWLM